MVTECISLGVSHLAMELGVWSSDTNVYTNVALSHPQLSAASSNILILLLYPELTLFEDLICGKDCAESRCVNSYSLHEGDDWVTHKELELWPLDGGSQRGRKSIRILHILRTRL